jgi:Entner-Doudoroff aldolase
MTVSTPRASVDTLERIEKLGVLPVIELGSVSQARPLLEALSTAGLAAAEITLRTKAGPEAIGMLRGSLPDALVGAGTVRSPQDVRRVVEQGAQFVVSPSTDPEVIAACGSLGVPSLPGACTPTEVETGVKASAGLVKFFPAEAVGGIAFLRALAGPFPNVRFVPTGGVNASNLRDHLETADCRRLRRDVAGEAATARGRAIR